MSVPEQVTKRGGVVERLSTLASRISGGEPVLDRARDRAREAVEIVSAAVVVDPTLLDRDRDRDIEVVAELLRQLHPLAHQAAHALEHGRLTATNAPARANLPGSAGSTPWPRLSWTPCRSTWSYSPSGSGPQRSRTGTPPAASGNGPSACCPPRAS
ncbi:hypothetical protein [Umezawaea sp. Da 62-37]|uniref:hypothetical protein n=1 Tax=Umezawaea sp. Da 62-37 TaxID=3075927 RepID=UPI0028F734F5|nr:hypothetical protein [Umezawaea sp. Da 62-37]WNV86670.1 hypothetical protein RM788_52585 [Umezawaea sp. Da 62-37]WNV86747.1 hypothetical protein RM788_00220 [Umezawaea sp. Da 62-37]